MIVILLTFMCLRCAGSLLNLEEGADCATDGVNGTCASVHKCYSAALIHIYSAAGFDKDLIPQLPEVCSYKNDEPIYCCTDCKLDTSESLRNKALGPGGRMVLKQERKAWIKCLEHFQSLPYPCRGLASSRPFKIYDVQNKCHKIDYESISVEEEIGGRDALEKEFPHMALLGFGENQESAEWVCGGSVISERFILTAAHCTSDPYRRPVKFAALGILKRSDIPRYWNIYEIKRIIIHPEYKSPSKYNDIALLETQNEINFGRSLLPACFVTLDQNTNDNYMVQAPGWGQLGPNQHLAETLQVGELIAFNESQCAALFPEHRHLTIGYDHKTQMCYGAPHGKIVDSCKGDSGGPIQTSDIGCMYNVIGVTSFGRKCGVVGSAGIYTRVQYYLDWIENIVWP